MVAGTGARALARHARHGAALRSRPTGSIIFLNYYQITQLLFYLR